MATSLIIHGHFYQPPRENPWTGSIERQPSAHPDHDWNERIYKECYRPNAFARVFGAFGMVERIVNNYAHLSFNIGPTLMSWIEDNHPVTYRRILQADVESSRRLGHGSAIAQGYGHAILPLCNERDRVTQIRWGVEDFRHRFGRLPASMWLPETAANDATLGSLIDEGMRFLILSPYQAERVRPLRASREAGPRERETSSGWRDVADGSIDPGVPYRYFHRDGSGRYLDIFFYDGPKSQGIAFEGALGSSQALVRRLANGGGGDGRLIHVATDGESYGHHHRFGELSLAHALLHEARAQGLEVTNYAAYLEAHPPTMEVEIKSGPNGEGTAWSCAHGVGRWYRDCGCSTGAQEGWNQSWRAPLRAALDVLRDDAVALFERQGGDLFSDPWVARDAYIELVLDRRRSRQEWCDRHARPGMGEDERVRALTLMEMQRNAMLMYTSCGWFFSDLSGIETVQILKYAERTFDLMESLGHVGPRGPFLERLAEARSNVSEHGNGADIYRRWVSPLRVSAGRVAAHLGILGLVEDHEVEGQAAGWEFVRTRTRKQKHGRLSLTTAHINLTDIPTGRRADYAVASMHVGGVDFYSVCRPYPGDQAYETAVSRLWQRFRTATLPQLFRLAAAEFGPEEHGLESLLEGQQHRIASLVHGSVVARFCEQYEAMFESNQRLLEMLQEAGLELPEELQRAAEFTLGRRFSNEIVQAHGSFNPASYQRALDIAGEVRRRGYKIDTTRAGHVFGRTLASAIEAALVDPTMERFEAARALAELTSPLGLAPRLWRAQELVYQAYEHHPDWKDVLRPLARAVNVRLPD